MKPSATPRNTDARTKGNGSSRPARGDIDARTLARLRTAAAIVRHRQEMLYDRLAERFRLACEEGVDKSRESLEIAAEKAREQLTAAGALTHQQGERLKACLIRDIGHTASEVSAVDSNAAERLDPSRLGEGAISSIASVLASAGDELHEVARAADESATCKTGEVTSAGMLTCRKCGSNLHFRKTGTVPPCPRCSSIEFRKGC